MANIVSAFGNRETATVCRLKRKDMVGCWRKLYNERIRNFVLLTKCYLVECVSGVNTVRHVARASEMCVKVWL
jgi:hypothetical protein